MIRPGDWVRVEGRKGRFHVTRIDPDGVIHAYGGTIGRERHRAFSVAVVRPLTSRQCATEATAALHRGDVRRARQLLDQGVRTSALEAREKAGCAA